MKKFINFEFKVRVAFLAAVVSVVLLSGVTWVLGREADATVKLVAQTQEVLLNLANTRSLTVQIELSTQSFRMTGDPARIEERNASIDARERLLAGLKTWTSTHAEQQARWQQLREVIDSRLAVSRRVEQLRKTEGMEAANAFVASTSLQQTRLRTYQLLDEMEQVELGLLASRKMAQSTARLYVIGSGLMVSLLLLVLLVATYFLIQRQFREAASIRRALEQSEESLAITLYSIGDAVMATDSTGRITRMNPVAERMTGWPIAQARGRPIDEVFRIINEQTRAPAEVPVAKVLATGDIHELANHTVLIARDGSECPIADSAAPIRGRRGEVQGVVIVFRDETASRQAEQWIRDQNNVLEQRVLERTAQLQDSENHLRSVINGVPALIAYVDADQRYVYVNAQYKERFAPDQDDIRGCTVRDILGDTRYAIAAPLIEQVLKGRAQSYDWEPFPGVWQVINYLPRLDAQGAIDGYFVLGTDITERRKIEEALRANEHRLARVLAGADQGYWDWNLQTNAFQVSDRWETMLGYEPGERAVDTEHWPDMVHPDDLAPAMDSIQKHVSGQTESHDVEIRCRTKQGGWRWIRTSGRIVERTPTGEPLIMSGTHTDITDHKQFELEQREAAVVFDNSYEGIMVANAEGLITKVNPAFTRITGYEQAEVVGRSPSLLSSGHHGQVFYQAFWATLRDDDFWRGEIWNKRKTGEVFAALQSISVVRDAKRQVSHYVSVFVDISQIKAHEVELDRVANYDSLTELPNRRLLSDRLRRSILRAERSSRMSAVCFLDLDQFKDINDRHGHAVGDQLLVGVSKHLTAVLRADDTLARIGGDEFVLLLSELGSPEECTLILDRVLQAVRLPVEVDGRVLNISASIGVSLYPADDADPDTLLRHADQAMYQAKQAGKNRYQLFDPQIDREAQSRRELLKQLRQALQRDELVLFYQPQVDLRDGSLIGAEALIRWQHPERGLLAPGLFLPSVQGSDLERDLGEWVMESALRQAAAWHSQGMRITVGINISANHLLHADFSTRLEAALQRHPTVPAASLDLEVLETAAITDMAQAVAMLNRCIALGVKFSLDDFGTGYSSLTYLRKLPVHMLKIDQSFVRDMLTDPDDMGIVQGVIELASAFHRQVIAEGVETLEHGAALRRIGCYLAQGYGIAKPMPAEQLAPWSVQWQASGVWARI